MTVAAAGVLVAGVLAATGRVELAPGRSGDAAAPVRVLSPQEKVPSRPGVARIAPTPHRLTVTSDPAGAQLRIAREDGVTTVMRTPFSGRVVGGRLRLTLTMPGYNPLVEHLDLDRDRTVQRWLDPAGLLHHKVGVLHTGPAPKQVAFTPDGREIWVSLLGGHGLQVFDRATMRPTADVRLGSHGAVEVVFTRDGRTVYASQMETASVFEIDRRTHRVRRQLPTKGTWSKVMALSADERTMYVANWVSNDVSEIDLASGRVRRLLPTVTTPRGLYPTADGRRLYVAGYARGELASVDLATGRSTVLLHTGGAMRHLVADPIHGRLYADDMGTNQAFVVDLRASTVRKLADTGHTPNTIDLSPDGRVLYVSNRGRNGSNYYLPGPEWGSILAIDTQTGRILDAIVGGNQPTGLDVSPDGRTLAYSDFLDDRITLYQIPSYARLAAGHGGRARSHLADLPK
ncbi:MAG TPA: beta-propeller fold lactonase family protein [Mycobacteriales bacterium]